MIMTSQKNRSELMCMNDLFDCYFIVLELMHGKISWCVYLYASITLNDVGACTTGLRNSVYDQIKLENFAYAKKMHRFV